MATEILRPNAVGDASQNTPNGAATGWQCVDETPPDEAATYVNAPAAPGWYGDLYNLPSSGVGSGIINSVTIYTRMRKTIFAGGTDTHGYTYIKTNGVSYGGSSTLLSLSWAYYSTAYTNNPQSVIAWSWAEINALQAGVALEYVIAGEDEGDGECTQVYIVIDYTPSQPSRGIADKMMAAGAI